jgi:hypothetical protein
MGSIDVTKAPRRLTDGLLLTGMSARRTQIGGEDGGWSFDRYRSWVGTRCGVAVSVALLVIYTERLEECCEFYRGLGLEFAREKHGDGPDHYAAVLDGGAVLELYPAAEGEATGRLRIGLCVSGTTPEGADRPPRRRTCRDPDGRTVEIAPARVEADG